LGAVAGAAAGDYGGGAGGGSGAVLSGGAALTALLKWLGLMAQALWLGAPVIELTVLAPARRAGQTPAARLAWAAAPRLWGLARAAPVVALAALVGELLSLAVQGTGGDWGRALAPATFGGILSSQNGHFILLRCAVLYAALVLTAGERVPALVTAPERVGRAPQALGITAPARALPRWEVVRACAALLAAAYLLLVAFSGHAADVTPSWLSYPIDWLHLLSTAAWVGGIAALAYGVVPLRCALAPEERALAVLPAAPATADRRTDGQSRARRRRRRPPRR
jgi:copper transport protein